MARPRPSGRRLSREGGGHIEPRRGNGGLDLPPLSDDAFGDARLWGFMESAPSGVVLCDRHGRITHVNPRIEQEFDYRAEELLGRPIEMLLPEAVRDVHVAHRERYAADPRPRSVAGRELTGRRKDGGEFPVEVGLSFYGEGDDLVLSAIVVDISERKAAEAEIRRSAERLEILHEIDREILRSASIEELVGSALERIHDLVGAERAAFVWFDHDEGVGTYLGAIQEPSLGPPAGTRVPLGDFPPFALDPRGPSTYLFDLQEWPERSPLLDRLRASGLRSVVAATIVQEGQVVGDLFASSTRPGAFSDADRTAIEEVASELAIAVRQVRLHEELAGRAATLGARERQQAAVARVGLLALEGSDMGVVFREATRAVAETLDVPLTKVLELLPDEDTLVLRAGVGWSQAQVGRTTVPAGADSQAGFTLVRGWPVVVEDLELETRFRGPRLLTDHGVVSGVSVVIGPPSAPWGVLGAHTRALRSFTGEDVDFLMAVAGVLGAGVERARARDEIVRRTRRLEGLREIDAQMLSAASPAEVAEAVLDVIHRQIQCDHATVWVRERDDTIAFLAAWNRDEETGDGPGPGAALPSENVIPAGLEGLDVYQPDIRAFEASTPILGWARSAGLRSLLVCTLVADGEYLGGLTVLSKEVDAFDRDQRETVRETADHLALAFRKARLDRELAGQAEDLRRLAEERRALLAAIVRAQEEERQRVGRELHDGLGQILTSVSLFAGDLEERVPEDLRPRAARVRELIGRAIADGRTLVWSLHPPELDRLGLVAALEHLLADVAQHGGVHVELHGDVGTLRMAVEAQAVVYRIVQEALNNAQKHSGAASISVVLTREADDLLVVVKDDGRGFDPERTDGTGIGMPGMRERAELIGGSVVVESAEGAGTTIRLAVPLEA